LIPDDDEDEDEEDDDEDEDEEDEEEEEVSIFNILLLSGNVSEKLDRFTSNINHKTD
jgi:hypothetical protein